MGPSTSRNANIKKAQAVVHRRADESTAPPDTRPIPMKGPGGVRLYLDGYRAGRDGRIWSGLKWGRWLEKKPTHERRGDLTVTVLYCGRVTKISVPHCVLAAWKEPKPPNCSPFHRDRDRTNNAIGNLIWAPRGICSMGPGGTVPRRNKLSAPHLRKAKVMYDTGVCYTELAELFGVSRATMCSALQGATHKGVIDPVTTRADSTARRGDDNGMSVLTQNDVLKAREMHSAGLGFCEIARRFGANRHTIRLAVKGITWKHVS